MFKKGNCYVFNSGRNSTDNVVPLKNTVRAGELYGLTLIIYANFYEYLEEYNELVGSYIKVGNSSYIDVNDGINISPGYETTVVIDRSFEFILPKPYSNCDIQNENNEIIYSDLYELILNSDYEYTQQLCFNVILISVYFFINT